MKLTRRAALKNLLGGAAIVATPGGILLAQAEPVRRFWQVGADLKNGGRTGALTPIEGQPGLFRDNRNGMLINIRDFSESDKYDSVVIPSDEMIAAQVDRIPGLPHPVIENGRLKHFIHDEFIHEDMTVKEAAVAAYEQGRELHIQLVKKKEPMTTIYHEDGSTHEITTAEAMRNMQRAAMRFHMG